MSHYRIYIFFSLIVAAGLTGIFLVSQGYYPIALVENDLISARRFVEEYTAASFYYKNVLKTYGSALRDVPRLTPSDLRLAVMNGIVEKVLISKGAKLETGEDLDYLISNKLAKFAGDEKLGEAVEALYGLTRKEFERDILIPQAEREILAGRLFLRGENLEDWLRKAKAAARVIIFSPQFGWNGEAVVGK